MRALRRGLEILKLSLLNWKVIDSLTAPGPGRAAPVRTIYTAGDD